MFFLFFGVFWTEVSEVWTKVLNLGCILIFLLLSSKFSFECSEIGELF